MCDRPKNSILGVSQLALRFVYRFRKNPLWFSITVQQSRAELKRGRHREPNLPVRKKTGWNGKLPGGVQIRRQPPKRQCASHHSGGCEQRGRRQSDVLVLAPLLPYPGAGTESYPDNHFVRISVYQFPLPQYRQANQFIL